MTVDAGGGPATVVCADVPVANGTVHIIDTVLLAGVLIHLARRPIGGADDGEGPAGPSLLRVAATVTRPEESVRRRFRTPRVIAMTPSIAPLLVPARGVARRSGTRSRADGRAGLAHW